MELADSIEAYYLAHRELLSPYYTFHFGSRLWCWSQDPEARTLLDGIYGSFCHGGNREQMAASLVKKLQTLPAPHINAHDLREPFLHKYPQLRPYNAILFQLRHWAHVYGIDLRPELAAVIPHEVLLDLRNRLLADSQALAFLSTYAINYLYLLDRFIRY